MIKTKSINWSHGCLVGLISWTNFRVLATSPMLLITGWLHASSRLTCFSNDSYSFPNTSTVSFLNHINPSLSSELNFTFYESTWYVSIVFKVNILKELFISIQTIEYISIVDKICQHFHYYQILALVQKSSFLYFLDCDRYRSVRRSAKQYLRANKPSRNNCKLFLLTFLKEGFLCRQ